MDTRRRTLASDPAVINAPPHSMIPMPASAMKSQTTLKSSGPSRGMRQSIAPGGRMSTMGASAGSSGSQEARRSTMSTAGRQDSGSRADGGMYGRSSSGRGSVNAPGSVRRSSSYASMRQSLAPQAPITSAVGGYNRVEDPRKAEYRNPQFQKACRENIEEFLMSTHKFQHSLGPKALFSPTQKEFQQIFTFLVRELDPSFVWGKSFESDCQTILRDMRYPSPEQISKTSLGAAGGPTAWPALLAMLNWLVDLARTIKLWHDPDFSSDPMVWPLDAVPDEYMDARLNWYFMTESYNQWFEGAEEFPELEAEMKERMYSRTDKAIKDMGDIENTFNKVDTQLRMLTQVDSPLKKANLEEENLLSDKSKFEKYIDSLQEKVDKLSQTVAKAKMATEERVAAIAALEEEKQRLERAVAAQNLSPEEVKRMNVETSTLKESIRDLQTKLADGHRQQGEQEIAVTRRMDDIETLSQEYNGLVNKLGLASGSRDFSIVVEMNQGDMTGVGVVSARMKEQIRPALQAFGDQVRGEYQQRANQKIELDDELDRMSSQRQAKEEEQKTLEVKLKIADDQADTFKMQSQAEAHEIQARVAKLEKEVSAMSMSSQQELLRLESELESLRVERTETIHAVRNRREKLSHDVTLHAQAILDGKDHVTQKFAELKAFTQTLTQS